MWIYWIVYNVICLIWSLVNPISESWTIYGFPIPNSRNYGVKNKWFLHFCVCSSHGLKSYKYRWQRKGSHVTNGSAQLDLRKLTDIAGDYRCQIYNDRGKTFWSWTHTVAIISPLDSKGIYKYVCYFECYYEAIWYINYNRLEMFPLL